MIDKKTFVDEVIRELCGIFGLDVIPVRVIKKSFFQQGVIGYYSRYNRCIYISDDYFNEANLDSLESLIIHEFAHYMVRELEKLEEHILICKEIIKNNSLVIKKLDFSYLNASPRVVFHPSPAHGDKFKRVLSVIARRYGKDIS